ncbi:MAG: aryl-sulfate sulfotransferase, partial [Bacteroidota bacterium]|nr:aryl-sulfate sulfotransferase [Bacteroidota bacterium]
MREKTTYHWSGARSRKAARVSPLGRISTAVAVLVLSLFSVYCTSVAQEAYGGYTLFGPTNSRTTYLIGMDGTPVHTWQHTLTTVYSTYLLPDGSLLRPAADPNAILRTGAYTGIIERVDWDGNVLWQYRYSSQDRIAHHDIEPMPNGNVLLIAWEVKSAAEAAAAGRVNPTAMWVDHLVEVKPTGPTDGEIVWEWHAWDHIIQDKDTAKKNYGVVREHPEILDVNLCQGVTGPWGGDWLHMNAVSYDPVRDLVTVSSHYTSELYVIDHSTTREEAAGHTGGRHGRGGDFLYRWGNPPNYGAPGPASFDVVHCSWWIPPGLPG